MNDYLLLSASVCACVLRFCILMLVAIKKMNKKNEFHKIATKLLFLIIYL